MSSVPEFDSSSPSAVLSDPNELFDPIGPRSAEELLDSIFRSVGGPGNMPTQVEDSPVAESDSPTNSVGTTDSPSTLSTSITSVVSVVPIVLPSTFASLLLTEAREWWLLLAHCIQDIHSSLLAGQLGFVTSITTSQAKTVLVSCIQEHQKHHPGWRPGIVHNLALDGEARRFSSSWNDVTFRKLFVRELKDLPKAFFTRAWTACTTLMVPAQGPTVDPLHYPRFALLHKIHGASAAERAHAQNVILWHQRFGCCHWHNIDVPNVFDESTVVIHWFSDPVTRDILYHALRNPHSAGWLSVLSPELDGTVLRFRLLNNGTLQTVSFVLAWIFVVIQSDVLQLNNFHPSKLRKDRLRAVQKQYDITYAFLLSILQRTNQYLTPDEAENAREALLGWLEVRPVW